MEFLAFYFLSLTHRSYLTSARKNLLPTLPPGDSQQCSGITEKHRHQACHIALSIILTLSFHHRWCAPSLHIPPEGVGPLVSFFTKSYQLSWPPRPSLARCCFLDPLIMKSFTNRKNLHSHWCYPPDHPQMTCCAPVSLVTPHAPPTPLHSPSSSLKFSDNGHWCTTPGIDIILNGDLTCGRRSVSNVHFR